MAALLLHMEIAKWFREGFMKQCFVGFPPRPFFKDLQDQCFNFKYFLSCLGMVVLS